MKSNKINIIVIALIVIFTSCKKENLKNQTEPKDFVKTANMKMNYYGKILEYTVLRSPSTGQSKLTGEDAVLANEIINKNKNSVAIFESENEITFFNNIGDYAFHRKIDKSFKRNNRISVSNTVDDVQTSDFSIKLYQHANYQNLLQQHDFNSRAQGLQNFVLYYDCNQIEHNFFKGDMTTQNDCAGQTAQLNGFKVPWVGSSQNDTYTSVELIKNTNITGVYCDIVFFQNADFGGKAFVLQYRGNNVRVPNLSNYRFNAYQQTWNDSVSSYYSYNW